jgi:integrase
MRQVWVRSQPQGIGIPPDDLRHSLGSLLITGQKSDVRTTQDILRHRFKLLLCTS